MIVSRSRAVISGQAVFPSRVDVMGELDQGGLRVHAEGIRTCRIRRPV